jgi:quercetin dioxygenase-like cupin family protein
MPVVVNAAETKIMRQGDGWRIITLADDAVFGTPALVAQRWELAPGARAPGFTQGDSEQLLYVIDGSGTAVVDSTALPLAGESVLWLEPGESCYFVAGADGLHILQGYAPG